MYAVIRTGGKQQKVKPGDVVEVEYLQPGDGDTVTFQPLLVVDDDGKTHVGKEIEKAVVTAKLLGEHKGEKVHVFKYKSKSGYARKQGHRQLKTLIEIAEVKLPGRRAAAKASAEEPVEPVEPAEATEVTEAAESAESAESAEATEPSAG